MDPVPRKHILMLFVLANYCLDIAVSLEVDLLNTAHTTSDFNWDVHNINKAGIPENEFAEWEEVSHTLGNHTKRGFQICTDNQHVLPDKSQSWLIIPGIDISNINRIFIEIEFTLRDCADMKKASCRETFSVYYFYNDDASSFTFDHLMYTKIDTVAAEIRFTPHFSNDIENNREMVFVSNPGQRKVLHIAVVDEGACMAIMSIRVFHKICTAVKSNLAVFNASYTGLHDTSLVSMKGDCVSHSQLSSKMNEPVYHCTSEGKWQVQTGDCICNAGYMPNRAKTKCVPCNTGTYKSNDGNDKCKACPENSHTKYMASSTCKCDEEFYANDFPSCDLCSTFPKAPTNFKTQTMKELGHIIISWDKPMNDGNCEDVYYCILCFSELLNGHDGISYCDELEFSTKNCAISSNNVTVENLLGHTKYNFTIFTYNKVVEQFFPSLGELVKLQLDFEKSFSILQNFTANVSLNMISINYKTNDTLPSTVANIRVMYATLNTIALVWDAPKYPNGNIQYYEVCWISTSRFNSAVNNHMLLAKKPVLSLWNKAVVENTSTSIRGLYPGSMYYIIVRAFNNAGGGKVSEIVEARTSPIDKQTFTSDPTETLLSNKKYLIIAAGVIFLTLLCIGVIVVQCRYGKQCTKPTDTRETANDESHQLFNVVREATDQQLYVDPFSLDVGPLHNFKCEVSPESLYFNEVIGCGEFGDVYKGHMLVSEGIVEVAIKQLRDQCEPQEQVNFLREAYFLDQFNHENIVSLKAVITKSRPFIIITELMSNGSLLSFLHKKKSELELNVDLIPTIPMPVILEMLQGVAQGMLYLTNRGYVHRDLAARNVLCDENLTCKVADFGLTREVSNCAALVGKKNVQSGKIAVRWASPEAMAQRMFSEASDVWSFGVLCWEALTYGEKPYWNLTNQEIVGSLHEGFRLPAPECTPSLLYDLMLNCWLKDPLKRPTFKNIVHELQRLKLNEEELKVLVSPSNTGLADDTNDEIVFQYTEGSTMLNTASRVPMDIENGYFTKTDDSLSCASTICASDITMCAVPRAYLPRTSN